MGWGCVCVEHGRGHGEVAEEWGSWESWVGEMLVFPVLGWEGVCSGGPRMLGIAAWGVRGRRYWGS